MNSTSDSTNRVLDKSRLDFDGKIKMEPTLLNVVPINSDVIVPVKTRLFMPKSNSVHHLVHDNPFIITVIPDRDILRIAGHANVRIAPKKYMLLRYSSWMR